MATTHDCTALTQFTGSKAPYGSGNFSILKFHVDMAAITAEKGITVDGSASDVIQLWDIPLGTCILGGYVKVITAEGAAATVTVGTNAGTEVLVSAVNINSAGTVGALDLADTHGAAHMVFATADTLDLLFATDSDIDTAVFDVYVYCLFNEAVQ